MHSSDDEGIDVSAKTVPYVGPFLAFPYFHRAQQIFFAPAYARLVKERACPFMIQERIPARNESFARSFVPFLHVEGRIKGGGAKSELCISSSVKGG